MTNDNPINTTEKATKNSMCCNPGLFRCQLSKWSVQDAAGGALVHFWLPITSFVENMTDWRQFYGALKAKSSTRPNFVVGQETSPTNHINGEPSCGHSEIPPGQKRSTASLVLFFGATRPHNEASDQEGCLRGLINGLQLRRFLFGTYTSAGVCINCFEILEADRPACHPHKSQGMETNGVGKSA